MAADMDWLTQVLAIAGFFALRLLVPALVIGTLALFLRRMDRHWQAQADSERRQALDVTAALVPHPVIGLACYDQRHCSEEKRRHCAAAAHPETPCWLSRSAAEGALPGSCVSCGIYRLRVVERPGPVTVASGVQGATPAA